MDYEQVAEAVRRFPGFKETNGFISAATDGPQGTRVPVAVSSASTGSNIAGPFSVAPTETSANTSPQESGVALVDASCNNGNLAPLTLV